MGLIIKLQSLRIEGKKRSQIALILRFALFLCTAFPYFLYTTTPIFGFVPYVRSFFSISLFNVVPFPVRTTILTLFPLIRFPLLNSSRKIFLPFNEYSFFTCTRYNLFSRVSFVRYGQLVSALPSPVTEYRTS